MHFPTLRLPLLIAVASLFFLPAPLLAGSPITTLVQLQTASDASNGTEIYDLNLSANLWYANPAAGTAVLSDGKTTLVVINPIPAGSPEPGTAVNLTGQVTLEKRGDRIEIKPLRFIDNDGLHGELQRSRSVYLETGYYPFLVEWFNAIGEPGLIIEAEGPELERQRIPASYLFQNEPSAGKAAAPGLRFKTYQGRWWKLPPTLATLEAKETGQTEYFNVEDAEQREFVAASFQGFIHIETPGEYTFHLLSDDGSRLFLGPSSFSFSASNQTTEPPIPLRLQAGQSLPRKQPLAWASVLGSVTHIDSDSLTLSTDLGDTRIQFSNTSASNLDIVGKTVAATGVLMPHRTLDGLSLAGELWLQDPAIQLIPQKSKANPGFIPITEIEQFSPSQLKSKSPVSIHGVVTNSILGGYALVLQDESRAIFVDLNKIQPAPINKGELIEVIGSVEPGEFSPFIIADQFKRLGTGPMPDPIIATREEILNGSLHSQYVEIVGYVLDRDDHSLTLRTRAGSLNVGIETDTDPDWQNAVLQLRGCLRSFWDPDTREIVVGKIELNSAEIRVVRAAPEDLFDVSKKQVSDLLKFDPDADLFQRVGVRAQVLQVDGDQLLLAEDGKGLRATLAHDPSTSPRSGDVVDLVGFPEFDGPSPHFAHAIVRKINEQALPPSTRINPEEPLSDKLDSTRISIEGELLGLGQVEGRWTLQLRSASNVFAAPILDSRKPNYEIGSELLLTGVFMGLGGNRSLGQPIDAFEVLIDSSKDIAVLSTPPWWTMPRLLTVMGILCVILLFAFLWIKSLQSQVAFQTEQLRTVLEERHRKEQEEALAQERSRLAYDLHDELGAGLTEVGLLGTLAAAESLPIEKRDTHLKRLSDKVRHLVMSLDEIVWAVNPKYDSISSFVSYYTSYAQQFLSLADIPCRFDIAEDLPEEPLTARVRHSLFLCYKEALTNIVRHAQATEVIVRLYSEKRQLVVSISDNGKGLSDSIQIPGTDGLASMRERLDNLGGFCEIESDPSRGTTVTLKLPLQ